MIKICSEEEEEEQADAAGIVRRYLTLSDALGDG